MDSRLLKTAGIFASAVFALASCSNIAKMQVPESVSVKTNATYSANFGSYSKSLSDYFSADTITEQIASANSGSTSATVYDYNPGGSTTVQHFLIKYPAIDKSIDLSDSLSAIDLSTNLDNSVGFDKTFTIPSVNQTFSNTSSQDLNASITEAAVFSSAVISAYDAGDSSDHVTSIPDITITISKPAFTTMLYRSGSLNITLTPGSMPASGFSLVLQAALYHDSTELTSSGETTVTSGGTLSLPLSGVTLYPGLVLKLSGTVTASSSAATYTYTVAPALSTDAKISKITGVTMSSDDLGPAGTISLNKTISVGTISDSFVSATIGEGDVSIQTLLPDGWSGVTADSSFSVSGGLTGTFSDNGGSSYLINQSLDLSDKTFTPSDINVSGSTQLSLNNATIEFPETSAVSITTSGSCTISSFSNATIDLGSSFNPTYTYTTSVPDTMKGFVKTIYYDTADYHTIGLSFSYINGLPAGNDLTVTANSGFLNMTDKPATLASGTATSTSTELTSTYGSINVSSYSDIDITLNVALPGATTEHPTFTTITNITPGSSYTLSMGGFALVLDWSSISLDTSSLAQSGTMDTGLNISDLLSNVTDGMSETQKTEVEKLYNIQLTSLPIYLYVSKPSLLSNDLKLSGKMYLTASTSNTNTNGTEIDLLGSSSKTGNLTLPDTAPSIKTDDDGTVTSNLSVLSGLTQVDKDGKLPQIFTNELTALTVTYDVAVSNSGEITVKRSDLDNLKAGGGAVSISAVVYIDLPFSFKTIGAINLDLLALAGKSSTDDLLGRTEALDTSDYQKYLDAIKSITLGLTVGNTMGLSESYVKITDTDGIFGTDSDPLYLSGNSTVSLTGTQITSVLRTYPYMPTVTLTIPEDTEIIIPRDADISVGLSAKVATNGTIQLYGGDN